MSRMIPLVFSSLLGAVSLCIFSAVQKMAGGVPVLRLDLYVVPCLFGGVVGCLLGIWRLKLRRSQEKLRQANRTLEEKVKERTREIEKQKRLVGLAVEKEELSGRVLKEERNYYNQARSSLNDLINAVNSAEQAKYGRIAAEMKYNTLIIEWLRITDTLVTEKGPGK